MALFKKVISGFFQGILYPTSNTHKFNKIANNITCNTDYIKVFPKDYWTGCTSKATMTVPIEAMIKNLSI